MKQLYPLAALLFLCFPAVLPAQSTSQLEWPLPVKPGCSLIGKPAPDAFAIRENGRLTLIAAGNSRQDLPYDSISFLGGDLWQVWKNQLKGVFRSGKGEVVPPVYETAAPAWSAPGAWAFTIAKYGMSAAVNDQNRLILPWRGDSYSGFVPVNDTLVQYVDKKGFNFTNTGYVSRKGVVVPNADGDRLSTGKFQRLAADQYVFTYSQNGKVRRDTFASATDFNADNIAIVQKGAAFGYLNRDGSWLIRPRFQAALPFNALGHAAASEKGKFGIVRKNGSWLLPPAFEDLKSINPALYQFKEGAKTGLVDTTGKVLLKAGTYAELLTSGTSSFGVRVADSVQIYNYRGELLPVAHPTTYEGNEGHFLVRSRVADASGRKTDVVGIGVGATGAWLIPPVLFGRVLFGRHFILVETKMLEPVDLGGQKFDGKQGGEYLVLNRAGQLLLPYPVVYTPYTIGTEPYLPFTRDKKAGLVSTSGVVLPAEYSEVRVLNDGWISVRREGEWGMARWKG